MPLHTFKIVSVESELYEWDKPPIWNGMHVYDKGRLHLIKVTAQNGSDAFVGYGFNGGTAATRPLHLFSMFVDLFRPTLIERDVTDTDLYRAVSRELQNLWTRRLSYASFGSDKPSVLGYPRKDRG